MKQLDLFGSEQSHIDDGHGKYKTRIYLDSRDREYIVKLDPSIPEDLVCERTEATYLHDGEVQEVRNASTLQQLHDIFLERIESQEVE